MSPVRSFSGFRIQPGIHRRSSSESLVVHDAVRVQHKGRFHMRREVTLPSVTGTQCSLLWAAILLCDLNLKSQPAVYRPIPGRRAGIGSRDTPEVSVNPSLCVRSRQKTGGQLADARRGYGRSNFLRTGMGSRWPPNSAIPPPFRSELNEKDLFPRPQD